MNSRIFLRSLLAAAAVVATTSAHSEDWPSRSIRLVVPVPPGGVTDLAARLVAKSLTAKLGQTVYVENKSGAMGRLALSDVVRAKADGYTLLYGSNSGQVTAVTMKSMPADMTRDFVPIGQTFWYGLTIVCNTSVPASTFKELIDYAKKHPGKLTAASPGVGGGGHFSIELLNNMAGIQMVHIPYQGGGPAMQAVAGGHADCTHDGAAKPYIDTGRVKAFATTTLRRDPRLPNLPTVDESGIKGFEISWWQGLFVLADTPPAIVAKLETALRETMTETEVNSRAFEIGLNAQFLSGAVVRENLIRDTQKFRKIAADAKIQLSD